MSSSQIMRSVRAALYTGKTTTSFLVLETILSESLKRQILRFVRAERRVPGWEQVWGVRDWLGQIL
jgi:hypothetical protein